jgi:starvation-inducible DNA-binding protein
MCAATAQEIKTNNTQYQGVINGLSQLLADTYLLQLRSQNYHWNVVGCNFYQLHKLFEDQYNELSESVDLLAERIRTYGAKAPGSFEKFNQLSELSPDSEPESETGMLESLLEGHTQLKRTLYNCLKACQDVGDEATADVCIERARAHDKHIWMLKAQLD